MKKFISVILTISILLITLSATFFAAGAAVVNYAYLNNFAEQETEFGTDTPTVVVIQMFDSKGIETIYKCASTIKINGVTHSDTASVVNTLAKETYADFVLDEDGNICSLNYTNTIPTECSINAYLECVTFDKTSNEVSAKLHFNYVLHECMVIMAIYNNSGTLLNATWKSSPASGTNSITSAGADFDISLIDDTSYLGCPVKIFFWDAFDTIKPLNTVLSGTVVPSESDPQYGYVKAIAADEVSFGSTGSNLKFQLITADGIEVAELKSGAKLNVSDTYYETATSGDADTFGNSIVLDTASWTYSDVSKGTYTANAYTKFELLEKATVGQVVKYSKDYAGRLSTITTVGYNKSEGSAADFSTSAISGEVTYSAENPSFVANNDSSVGGNTYDTCTIFVVDDDVANCQTATLSDLTGGNSYNILASYTESSTGSANVLVMSYDTFVSLGLQQSIAVISEVAVTINVDGELIYELSYYIDRENLIAQTTSTVAAGTMPTAGDVVKLGFNKHGLISSLKYVWDFDESVRNFTTNEPVSLATGDNAYIAPNPDETLAGGVVTAFDNSTDKATINENEYKLSRAENIYVIDNTGRNLTIENGSVADFQYFPSLYNTVEGTLTLTDLSGTTTTTGDMSVAENRLTAMKYADHIYVRTYENRPVDVIIVKGFLDSVE